MPTEEMDEIKCWLWHSWGKWSDPVIAGKLLDYQERRCLDCNKIQRRYL